MKIKAKIGAVIYCPECGSVFEKDEVYMFGKYKVYLRCGMNNCKLYDEIFKFTPPTIDLERIDL